MGSSPPLLSPAAAVSSDCEPFLFSGENNPPFLVAARRALQKWASDVEIRSYPLYLRISKIETLLLSIRTSNST
jgi:hypothetical protein